MRNHVKPNRRENMAKGSRQRISTDSEWERTRHKWEKFLQATLRYIIISFSPIYPPILSSSIPAKTKVLCLSLCCFVRVSFALSLSLSVTLPICQGGCFIVHCFSIWWGVVYNNQAAACLPAQPENEPLKVFPALSMRMKEKRVRIFHIRRQAWWGVMDSAIVSLIFPQLISAQLRLLLLIYFVIYQHWQHWASVYILDFYAVDF